MTDGDQLGVAVAVVVQASRVLMIRRSVPEGELLWQFPGGKIEAGETEATASAREALEETGLTVKAVRLIGQRVHPKTGREMLYMACEVVDGQAHVADADEIDAVAWVGLDEIPEYVPYGLFEPVQEYLDEVLAG